MFTTVIIWIVLAKLGVIDTHFLEAESNYQKPRLERNNIINKRVWMKNKFKENSYEKATLGEFIFRANSLDIDNILQNNFNVFDEDGTQDSPAVSSYVKRAKRSNGVLRKQRSSKSIKNCKDSDCETHKYSPEETDSAKSKIINELKPASVFNDYPYEVAILLNNKRDYNYIKNDNLNVSNEAVDLTNNSLDFTTAPDIQGINNSLNNILGPKRSMKYDFETEVIKNVYENKTDHKVENKNYRDLSEKEDEGWHQTAPVSDVYKVVPKEPSKIKAVTERGLIKVISMLTKTFKKIMRQHNEIKDIHGKMHDMTHDFSKNAQEISQKFQEFDLKYVFLVKFNEDLKNFELKLKAKEEYFQTKEKEMASSLNEFENQQRKFLMQQRQFYNIQKLMLAQNEKINIKQNLIAKTQSEISHRQNNFARILKKTKQMYIDSKNFGATSLNISKGQQTEVKQRVDEHIKQDGLTTTSTMTPATESVKINLFSIPVSNKLVNHDDLIMKEKDEQPIDDLVYKYYFNNTFIDNLMKSKITGIVATSDAENIRRSVKTKRDDVTTILLPVNDSKVSIILKGLNRDRRWINNHSRHKNKRKNRGKGDQVTIINATDEKIITTKHINNMPLSVGPMSPSKPLKDKARGKTEVHNITADVIVPSRQRNDPFVSMAMNFCNELQANMNQQMKDWCIEKALRRLQYIDVALFPALSPSERTLNIPHPVTKSEVNIDHQTKSPNKPLIDHKDSAGIVKVETAPKLEIREVTGSTPTEVTSPDLITTDKMYILPTYTVQAATAVFFPDNDELESNLEQYELKPDIEGNVYYDGSLHASAFADTQSEFTDDFMPGLESNSRVEVDPLAFDVQAKRRAYIRQLNERIKSQLG